MNILETQNLSLQHKEQILDLWNTEYPVQLQYADMEGFDNYLSNLTQPNHLLVTGDNGDIAGWAFSFTRDNERWFAIIVDGSVQRKGLGTKLLNALKQKETVLNGWVTDHDRYAKPNGEMYISPFGFYLKNGFVVSFGTRLEIEKLSAVKITWTKTI